MTPPRSIPLLGILLAALCVVLTVSCGRHPAMTHPAAEIAEKPHDNQLPPAGPNARRYKISPESTIGFIGSKAVGRAHNGTFERFAGSFWVNDERLVGIDNRVIIEMASVSTDNQRLSGHLRSQDFFDVARYPEARFTVTRIEPLQFSDQPSPDGKSESLRSTHRIEGNFTLHGVTRGIAFPATITSGEKEILIQARFHIDRRRWNLTYSGKTGDDVINDAVVIRLDLVGRQS